MNTPNTRRIGNTNSPIIDVNPDNRPVWVLNKKVWIPGLLLILLVLAMVTSHFLTKPKAAPTAPQMSASEVQLRKEMDELKKQLAAKPAEVAPLAPPVAAKPVVPVTDQVSPKGDNEVDSSEQSVKVEFVPYDSKRHTAQKVQPYTSQISMHTFGGDSEPTFSVKSTPDKVKTRQGMVMARPVFVKPGIPLIAREGETAPHLVDTSLTPYVLNVWNQPTGEYRAIWFAK